MAFPAKEYNRLQSLQKIWDVSQEDMWYVVESGLLRACIWLPLRFVERGVIKQRKFIFESQETTEGFVGVRPEDCRKICSTGRARLRIFNSVGEDGHILRLPYEPPQPALSVRLHDLVVLKKDRQKFEKTYDICETNVRDLHPDRASSGFMASEDYRYVKLNSREYHLGDIQARVIEMLHDAAQSQKPWVHSKTLLFESGSNAERIRDVFRTQKHWQELIISNKRGYYRLNIPMEKLEASAQSSPAQSLVQQAFSAGGCLISHQIPTPAPISLTTQAPDMVFS
ncbi:MAG: hypothetical protein H6908_03520 [Hyphomicrobiales bacterium]|nr:hypothetical protein [Hyphomicrobiales bacterium]